jgi:hypothetical protein
LSKIESPRRTRWAMYADAAAMVLSPI